MGYIGIAFLLGRLLFGGYFIAAALKHLLTQRTEQAAYARMKNVPMPATAVLVTGILLLFGGAGILFWVYVPWAILALLIFLIPVSFMMHAYWKDSDPNMRMANNINFWKNMALVGALLLLFSLI